MNNKYKIQEIEILKEKLKNTVSQIHYNGWSNRTKYGYHSFNIDNIQINGQRKPWIRLDNIKKYYNFENKTLIDFGCNTGGMIFHLPELKKAIGIDFDKECIESCNYMASILKNKTEYKFIQQDLNNFDFSIFLKNNSIEKVDIIFLLSLGSWIKKWSILYKECLKYCDNIILETNNDIEGKQQLEFFKNLNCNIILISSNSYDDTTNNFGRKTYLVTLKH